MIIQRSFVFKRESQKKAPPKRMPPTPGQRKVYWKGGGETVDFELTDGSCSPLTFKKHPDPFVQEVFEAEVIGNLVQRAARPRLINRGPDEPGILIIVCDDALPIEVDAVVDWNDVSEYKSGVLLSQGIITSNPDHLLKLFPNILSSRVQAHEITKEFSTSSPKGENPIYKYILEKTPVGELGQLKKLRYRERGRQNWSTATYLQCFIENPQTWLSDKLGLDLEFEESIWNKMMDLGRIFKSPTAAWKYYGSKIGRSLSAIKRSMDEGFAIPENWKLEKISVPGMHNKQKSWVAG